MSEKPAEYLLNYIQSNNRHNMYNKESFEKYFINLYIYFDINKRTQILKDMTRDMRNDLVFYRDNLSVLSESMNDPIKLAKLKKN